MNVTHYRAVLVLISVFVFGSYMQVHAQDDQDENQKGEGKSNLSSLFTEGLTIQIGMVKSKAVHELYSKAQYIGYGQVYSLNWLKQHQKYVSHVHFDFGESELNWYNYTSDLTTFRWSQSYLYSPRFMRSSRTELLIGPEVLFGFNFRDQQHSEQNSAKPGFNFFAILSVGLNVEFLYKISPSLRLQYSLSSSLFSLGSQLPDASANEFAVVRLMAFHQVNHLNSSLSINYSICNRATVGFSYRFNDQYINPSENWDTEYAWYRTKIASDMILLNLKWNI